MLIVTKNKVFNWLYTHRSILMLGFIVLLCFDGTNAMYATGVGDAINNGANEILQEVARVYCGSLAFLLLAIEVLIFLISKNDKAKQAAAIAAVGTVVAWIVLKVLSSANGGVIGSTIETATDWVN